MYVLHLIMNPAKILVAPLDRTVDGRGTVSNNLDIQIMTSMQIILAREYKGWPLYSIILALGQMLGATSFQITLLSGHNYQRDLELYVLGCVFFAASLVWYSLFRFKPSIYVLSYPWAFYGLAFFLIGVPSISDSFSPLTHDILTNVATWSYAIASAAGFLFFGLNFGEEAVSSPCCILFNIILTLLQGVATEVWTMRACIVQGSQQIWVTALWYWGHRLNGALPGSKTPWWIIIILWPLAALCLFFVRCLLRGLPGEFLRRFFKGVVDEAHRVLSPNPTQGTKFC